MNRGANLGRSYTSWENGSKSILETLHCRCYLLDTVFPESKTLRQQPVFFCVCVHFCDSLSLSVNWQQPVK